MKRMGSTHVIDQSDTFHMHMFSVKRVLQKFDDIITDRVLRGETFSPCKNLSGIECRLFHRKRESETEMNNIGSLVGSSLAWRCVCGGRMCG